MDSFFSWKFFSPLYIIVCVIISLKANCYEQHPEAPRCSKQVVHAGRAGDCAALFCGRVCPPTVHLTCFPFVFLAVFRLYVSLSMRDDHLCQLCFQTQGSSVLTFCKTHDSQLLCNVVLLQLVLQCILSLTSVPLVLELFMCACPKLVAPHCCRYRRH